ncbi:hypothetical protein ACS0TY_003331 [Phlomoides rotata]
MSNSALQGINSQSHSISHIPISSAGKHKKRTWNRDARERERGSNQTDETREVGISGIGKRHLDDVNVPMEIDSMYHDSKKAKQDVDIKSYLQNHIDAIIHDVDGGGDWIFTGVYGWPGDQDKWKTWRMLDHLANGNTLPWLCLGDFNEILFNYEKRGGVPRRKSRMEDFRLCLERNGLMDLGKR